MCNGILTARSIYDRVVVNRLSLTFESQAQGVASIHWDLSTSWNSDMLILFIATDNSRLGIELNRWGFILIN